MRVLSLFDGISCARVAVGECEYFACEIDKYAIQVSKSNFPDIVHLGDVKTAILPKDIDLLIGGSPCTDLSIAKKDRKGLEGIHSRLFWEYVRVLKEIKPKWFILENVASMPNKDKDIITKALGVEPIMINAALVSAQSRKRLFWTNIPVEGLPEDKGIMLKDILEDVEGQIKPMTTIKPKGNDFKQIGYLGSKNSGVGGQALRVYDPEYKAPTSGVGLYKIKETIRRLTPLECERLQSLPDNYTSGISNTQRYKCLGNAFNVEVIKFILSFIPN